MELDLKESWYSLSVEDALSALKSSRHGLSEKEAEKRLKHFGLNELPDKNGAGVFKIFLRQFKGPLIFILVIAGFVSLFLADFIDSAIIFGAVVLNSVIGFFQEWKVSNILRELRKFVKYRSAVKRDGKIFLVESTEVAIGDILVLRQGDRIPTDARLIKATDFRTNEAVLTGESAPVEKTTHIIFEKAPVAERNNMVFAGTFVEEGTAEAVVAAVGIHTEFGKIASLIKKREEPQTPLQLKLASLAKGLGLVFVAISAILFIIGIFAGREVFTMFLTSVAVAVAAIPESLPVALMATLAIGARRILNKGGLVRKMLAAETLGSTSVICADKTATLTEGKMHVTKFVSAGGDEPDPKNSFENLKLLSFLSNAILENPEVPKNEYKFAGSPIDKAILLTALEAGINREEILKDMPRLAEIPFDAKHKYSVVLHQSGNENILVVLGAPEVILKISGKENSDGLKKKVDEFAGEGFRVLALASKKVSEQEISRSAVNGLDFACLVAFSDPIRKDVAKAVETARLAGIRPVMLTGDHLLTAEYIAKELGILKGDARSIEGKDLPKNLEGWIENYDVFARVTPEDKIRIVRAFKAKGENVAMLGDGVNDAPALIEADIGVAVGSGTDVAKEASDLVLLNDSFSIIVEAIRQGRIILDNIKKAVVFLLSSAFSEIILIAGSIFAGLPLALLPAQILWVNIIVDGLPTIALAFENEHDHTMKRKPDKTRIILNRGLKMLIAIFTAVTDLALFFLFYYLFKQTGSIEYARTMAFLGLGMTSLFFIFSVRSLQKPVWQMNPFSNRFLVFGVLFGFGMYFLGIYVEPLRKILGTVPLGAYDWLTIFVLSIFNIVVIEIGKFAFLRNK